MVWNHDVGWWEQTHLSSSADQLAIFNSSPKSNVAKMQKNEVIIKLSCELMLFSCEPCYSLGRYHSLSKLQPKTDTVHNPTSRFSIYSLETKILGTSHTSHTSHTSPSLYSYTPTSTPLELPNTLSDQSPQATTPQSLPLPTHQHCDITHPINSNQSTILKIEYSKTN